MSLLVAYARIATSLRNLYGRHSPKSNTTVAVAFAMSGLFVINVWTILLCASLVDHGWLASRRRISGIELALFLFGVVFAEFIAVGLVDRKMARDRTFFARVGTAPPKIAIYYLFISVGLLGMLTVVGLITDWR
jgi:hypothetical protein